MAGINFLLLTREENPTRPIFFSRHEKKIHRDQFSSPATRRKSIATNFLLQPRAANPTRPIFFSREIFQTVCVRLLEQLTIVKDADGSLSVDRNASRTLPSNCVRRFCRYCLSRIRGAGSTRIAPLKAYTIV